MKDRIIFYIKINVRIFIRISCNIKVALRKMRTFEKNVPLNDIEFKKTGI